MKKKKETSLEKGMVFASRYRLQQILYSSEFTEVWEARDTGSKNETVAVKTFVTDKKLDPDVRMLLKMEVSQTQNWRHRYLLLPKVFDFADDIPYLVLPFLKQGSLFDRLSNCEKNNILSEEELLRLLVQVGQALNYLHIHKVVHLGIKPSNILVGDDGSFILTDFGISRILHNTFSHGHGPIGVLLPSYAAPEQFESPSSDGASDVFSLGVMLHELATGSLPWDGVGGEVLLKNPNLIPPLPDDFSDGLKELYTSFLRREPAERPTAEDVVQTARKLLRQLQRQAKESARRNREKAAKLKEKQARRKAEEEQKRREEEKKREELQRKLEQERKEKEERARLKAEEERKKRKEEERNKLERERKEKEESARRKAEEEMRNKVEKERKRIEEELRRKELELKKKEAEARRKVEEETRRRTEEERKRVEEELRRKEEELRQKEQETLRKVEEKAQRKVDKERKRLEKELKLKEEELRKKEEDVRRKVEEEAKRKAEEERKRIEEELRRKEEELRAKEEEARRKVEEEVRRKAEEEKERVAKELKRKEEELRKKEQDVLRKVEEEARRKAEEERRRIEKELERKEKELKKKEEETLRKVEEEARRKIEEERVRIEEELRRKEEELKQREELARLASEEERKRREEEFKRKEEELLRKQEEARKAEEEARRIAEEEERRRKEEEARLAEEEERMRREDEERKRREDELRRKEQELRKKEEELRRKEEEARRKAEEERRRKEREEALRKIEEEIRLQEQLAEERRKQEEEERKRQEEEEFRKIEEIELQKLAVEMAKEHARDALLQESLLEPPHENADKQGKVSGNGNDRDNRAEQDLIELPAVTSLSPVPAQGDEPVPVSAFSAAGEREFAAAAFNDPAAADAALKASETAEEAEADDDHMASENELEKFSGRPGIKWFRVLLLSVILLVSGIAATYFVQWRVSAVNPEVILKIRSAAGVASDLLPALAREYMFHLGAADVNVSEDRNGDIRVTGFMEGKKTPLEIVINSSGSDAAISGLASKSCDLGVTTRIMSAEEQDKVYGEGTTLVHNNEYVMGLDAYAVIVNPRNPIQSLSLDQLKNILAGRVTRWATVGGSGGGKIRVYVPVHATDIFHEFGISTEPGDVRENNIQTRDTDSSIAVKVLRDYTGIGLVKVGNQGRARVVPLSAYGHRPMLPDFTSIESEEYPLTRRLYLYTHPFTSNNFVDGFREFVLSDTGQTFLRGLGYYDLLLHKMIPRVRGAAPGPYMNATRNARKFVYSLRLRPGTSILDTRSQREISRVADYLNRPENTDRQLLLFGFSGKIGSPEGEQVISEDLAHSVATLFLERGVEPAVAMGLGAALPLYSNSTPAGREKNRRVEMWIR